MSKIICCYGLGLAASAFLLAWVEYQHLIRMFPTESYVVLMATGFTALGIWAGRSLTSAPQTEAAAIDSDARASIGISDREYETLKLLADGLTNKQIARRLGISPNTVKTHLANLYGKLGVSRRTQAIARARSLALIP